MNFDFPQNFFFADSHEFACQEGELIRIGISAFAVDQLGDIVFVDLPDKGSFVDQGVSFGSVESVKAVEDMNSPVDGEITKINESVMSNPEELQNDPHGKGWLMLIKPTDKSQIHDLLDSDSYAKKIGES